MVNDIGFGIKLSGLNFTYHVLIVNNRIFFYEVVVRITLVHS